MRLRILVSAAAARLFLIGYLPAATAKLDAVFLLIRLRSVLRLHFALDLASHKSESVFDVERALG